MAIGGIQIDDHVMIGPAVTLLTANQDFNNHNILLVKKLHIKLKKMLGLVRKRQFYLGFLLGKG